MARNNRLLSTFSRLCAVAFGFDEDGVAELVAYGAPEPETPPTLRVSHYSPNGELLEHRELHPSVQIEMSDLYLNPRRDELWFTHFDAENQMSVSHIDLSQEEVRVVRALPRSSILGMAPHWRQDVVLSSFAAKTNEDALSSLDATASTTSIRRGNTSLVWTAGFPHLIVFSQDSSTLYLNGFRGRACLCRTRSHTALRNTRGSFDSLLTPSKVLRHQASRRADTSSLLGGGGIALSGTYPASGYASGYTLPPPPCLSCVPRDGDTRRKRDFYQTVPMGTIRSANASASERLWVANSMAAPFFLRPQNSSMKMVAQAAVEVRGKAHQAVG